jgi:hypothetical protein
MSVVDLRQEEKQYSAFLYKPDFIGRRIEFNRLSIIKQSDVSPNEIGLVEKS